MSVGSGARGMCDWSHGICTLHSLSTGKSKTGASWSGSRGRAVVGSFMARSSIWPIVLVESWVDQVIDRCGLGDFIRPCRGHLRQVGPPAPLALRA